MFLFHTCGTSVNHYDHVIRDVILNGLYRTDIRKEVLNTQETINKVIPFVETKRMAVMAFPPAHYRLSLPFLCGH